MRSHFFSLSPEMARNYMLDDEGVTERAGVRGNPAVLFSTCYGRVRVKHWIWVHYIITYLIPALSDSQTRNMKHTT